ncbi:MAG: hypothetical protein GOMPHAMPRED_007450 [Gomphillus americanus]|uniref:Uncharacterized protein n=1 Tax=Gomphillus americanus TaxID=1940652 RepID=A0A8H3ERS4_9LECA|nr:MAG: hypothetical protein GOMPHAMPRED_007450 [Gomphillus americanus]
MLAGMRRRSASTTLAEMRSVYSRSPRLSAHLTRDASTQYSSPETPELERSSVTGKRKDRAVEGDEVMRDESSPPRPQLTPQIPAVAPVPTKIAEPPPHAVSNAPIASSSTSIPPATSGAQSVDTTQSKKPRPLDAEAKIVPASYEDCPTSDLVPIIASMLMELIRHNDDMPVTNTGLTRFHSRAPPGISVRDYLQRLAHHATLSPPILLSMVYYIDRLCSLWPKFTINSLTVHRYLITSATVASKGLSDSFWTNSTYARVGGVSLKELALLELEFLWRIEWRIVPNPEVLVDYYKSLVQNCEGYEISQSTTTANANNDSGEVVDDTEMSK